MEEDINGGMVIFEFLQYDERFMKHILFSRNTVE